MPVAAAAAAAAAPGVGRTHGRRGRGFDSGARVLRQERAEPGLPGVEGPGQRGIDGGLVGDLDAAVEEEAAELLKSFWKDGGKG